MITQRHTTTMGFGRSTKYVQVFPGDLRCKSLKNQESDSDKIQLWDEAVEVASSQYDQEMVWSLT